MLFLSFSVHLPPLCSGEGGYGELESGINEMASTTPQNTHHRTYKQAANRGEPHRETFACPSRRAEIDWCVEELGSIWCAPSYTISLPFAQWLT